MMIGTLPPTGSIERKLYQRDGTRHQHCILQQRHWTAANCSRVAHRGARAGKWSGWGQVTDEHRQHMLQPSGIACPSGFWP